jgi:hypothetical protein
LSLKSPDEAVRGVRTSLRRRVVGTAYAASEVEVIEERGSVVVRESFVDGCDEGNQDGAVLVWVLVS